VMKPEPFYRAVNDIKSKTDTRVILLDPRGIRFNQKKAVRAFIVTIILHFYAADMKALMTGSETLWLTR